MQWLVVAGLVLLTWLWVTGRLAGLVHQAPTSRQADKPAVLPPLDEARLLLGVPPEADRADILLAHKRLIRKAHPDGGGDAELARELNAARDALLRALDQAS